MRRIGERVIVNTLLWDGDFPGEIIDVSEFNNLCAVKLDRQDQPIYSVLYYDEPPEVVCSQLWQICYPEVQEELSK